MSGSESGSGPEAGSSTRYERVDSGEPLPEEQREPVGLAIWLRTRAGIAVALVWVGVLVVLFALVRMTPMTMLINTAAVLFGLYFSSVAFRKDRSAGYVILIGMAFSILLLNSFLYLVQTLPRFGG